MRVLGFLLLAGLVTGCGKVAPKPTRDKATGTESKTLPNVQVTPPGTPDKERLQGVWVVNSIEPGHVLAASPQEEMKLLRFQFLGDRLLVTNEHTVLVLHRYVLDESKSPKWLTAALFNGKGEPVVSISPGTDGNPVSTQRMRNWVYKFDGEDLVFAEAPQGGNNFRPLELKASPAVSAKSGAAVDTFHPAVDVYHLKKTSEPPITEALIPKIHDTKK